MKTTKTMTNEISTGVNLITIEKTGYNYRTRKDRDILAFVLDASGEVLDAIAPGIGNHRAALDWAEWRAESIRKDYPAAVRMEVHCGDIEIAVITFAEYTAAEALNFSAKVRETVEKRRMRSAWDKSVQAYALELLDKYDVTFGAYIGIRSFRTKSATFLHLSRC